MMDALSKWLEVKAISSTMTKKTITAYWMRYLPHMISESVSVGQWAAVYIHRV